ncbi:CS1-pili formation C-terminal domain-containing protein [Photobacterium sp. GJ3]|uniref:CS1-pili formation C-terminal domain-containing protein n=1 Tax=Photobacterium sp. GJ3 TaxID=2829502 RepID=UPI002011C2C4|nr:CS1-pili formation C-terminal domain-containing protein [Photobacterium sp. GJ3]
MNYDSDNSDNYNISLLWNIPISKLFSAESNLSFDNNGVSQFSNGISSNDLVKDRSVYASISADNNYSDNRTDNSKYFSSDVNVQVNRDAFSANGYGYIDSNGEKNMNLGFSSSQVITGNGVKATSKRSNAYIYVSSENNVRNGDNLSSQGLLVLDKNDKYNRNMTLYNDSNLIPVDLYSDYDATINVESVDLYNSGGKRISGYAQPGTVLEVKPKLRRIVTFIAGFKDIFDQSLRDIQCKGDGCLTVSNITDGVYKVSVLEGENFTLNDNQYRCILPSISQSGLMNFGENYCLPNLSTSENMFITFNNKKRIMTYVGSYSKKIEKSVLNEKISMMDSKDVDIRKVNVANNILVYVLSDDAASITAKTKRVIKDLQQYANRDIQISKDYALQAYSRAE